MIRALALISAIGLALPAAAETKMTSETCLSGWQSFNFLIGTPPRLRAVQPDVTDDGWCRIDRSIADLRADDFDQVIWRATGVEEAVEKKGFPLTFEAAFNGIDLIEAFDMPLPESERGSMGTLLLKANRMPETRAFSVEQFTFDFSDLGLAKMSFRGGGIDLSGLSQMQLSLGGLRLNEANLSLFTTETLSTALFPSFFEEELLAQLPQALDLIPEDAMDAASRSALLAFVTAGAGAEGQLDVSMSSENGLGFLQVVGGAMTLEDSDGGAEDLALAMAQILSGVTLSATWTPDS